MKACFFSLGFVVAAFAAGCGGSDPNDAPGDQDEPVDCDAEMVPGYSELSIFADVCTNCHSSELTGPQRSGAPATLNFDTYEGASDAATRILGQVKTGNMPPAGSGYSLTTEQKHDLYLWVECDMPR